jgi:adenine-specific DNA-methyltransferase
MANYQKLQKVLTELFELDKAELDFGIYRIMNQKRADVLDFIENKLPKEVRAILENKQQQDTTALKKNLDDAIKMAKEFGLDPDTTPKVQEARALYETAGSITALEQEVFSHLASFFKRYYQDGDFISLRRYKKDVYAIPYEGEEVKLHWANHDQYYIKTSENLKNYAFKIDGNKTIKFTLKEANTEQNNNKTQKDQERRFALYEEEPITVEGDTLHLNFTYEPHKKTVNQAKLLEDAVSVLTTKVPTDFARIFSLAPTEKNKKRTLLEKHLNDFSARNTFDYFIHKDLGGFLSRELDFYIKNEVLFIDDINTENEQAFNTQLSKIRALKQVAQKIIAFLAQIENFQKKLWLKKKFVISCDYCITLDRIPEKYYAEITKNKAQLEEWKALFNVTITNEAELKEDPFLVLDTKFFPQEFKDELLAEFDDLDEITNGLLINSDNFQGVNFISDKYKNSIQSVYIDPPYNTVHSKILYKNQFEHSSWLSLINNNLDLLPKIWSDDFSFGLAIDDYEFTRLSNLLISKYPFLEHSNIVINHHPQGSGGRLSRTHEYYILISDPNSPQYLGEGEDSIYEERSFMRSGTAENNYRYGRWKSFYALLFDKTQNKFVGIENPPEIGIEYPLEDTSEGYQRIYPINSRNEERVWRSSYETGRKRIEKEELFITERGSIKQKIFHEKKASVVFSNWTGPIYNAGAQGSNVLRDMGIEFDYPKSVKTMQHCIEIQSFGKKNNIVLDYFGGSGTTGHAIINSNREAEGLKSRKFIIIDVGAYFDTVIKQRIQKVIYTDNWQDKKPRDKKGISQMFKYFKLESYEDALNNLHLKPSTSQQQLLATHNDVQEEYLLQYMLDVESREHLMNVEAFKNPFNYKLKVTENNELIPTTVDLVETFNYLIGLHVKRIQRTGAFKTVEGVTNRGDKVLVIWRNLEESDNEDLNKFVKKMDYNLRDGEFDTIYVNGDNNLANLKKEEETWKVLLLEEVFFTEMFDVKDV